MTLADRVAKLERDNRRLRRVGLLLVLLAASALSLGAVAQTEGRIDAEEIRIKDTEGRVRAALRVKGSSVGLFLFAHNGSVLGLGASIRGGRVFLQDRRRRTRAELSIVDDAPSFTLYDASQRPRVSLEMKAEAGPAIRIHDAQSQVIWRAPGG